MIYFTGDTHNDIDLGKVFYFIKSENYNVDIKNYLIITGDFGIPWFSKDHKNRKFDKALLDDLNDLVIKYDFDLLFCDGNHENFDALYEYPVIKKFDGSTHQLRSNIFHLIRGEIFTIKDKKVFVFGGAESIDKNRRTIGESWWPQEQPTYVEYNYGIDNLAKHNNTVDFIVTHTAPAKIVKQLGFSNSDKFNDPVVKYLDHIDSIVKYDKWFLGHFHKDEVFDSKYFAMYNKIRIG